MALKKEIELDNGIYLNYHRIVSINKIVNKCNIIEVASYTSRQKRKEEKDYYDSSNEIEGINVYINTEYIEKEYDDNETVEDAYNYLKTLTKYENATDI